MTQMKILLISSKYYPEYSGSGYRAHKTYLRLSKKYEIEFDVICNSKNFIRNRRYTHDGVKILRIGSPFPLREKRNILYYPKQLINVFWQMFYILGFLIKHHHKYSLLHTFGDTWTIGFATLFFSYKRKPIIRELCNDTNYPMYPIQIHSIIASIFKSENTLIVAISDRLKKSAEKYNPFKIWCRNNPVDENRFNLNYNKQELLRDLTPFKNSDIILSIIANIIPRKNQLFCLQVLSRLPEKFKLIIAGPLKKENKKYFDELIRFIELNNLTKRVHINCEFISNIEEYMKLSDIFLFPSLSEGLGTPVLEAQACGTPVVANLINGITDKIIENGKGGFAIPLNQELWVQKILNSLEIDQKDLKSNSLKVLGISSSKEIDAGYYKIINTLFNEK